MRSGRTVPIPVLVVVASVWLSEDIPRPSLMLYRAIQIFIEWSGGKVTAPVMVVSFSQSRHHHSKARKSHIKLGNPTQNRNPTQNWKIPLGNPKSLKTGQSPHKLGIQAIQNWEIPSQTGNIQPKIGKSPLKTGQSRPTMEIPGSLKTGKSQTSKLGNGKSPLKTGKSHSRWEIPTQNWDIPRADYHLTLNDIPSDDLDFYKTV